MASNKLFEAAAEILAGSKKSASAMPMQKPEGAGVQDLGGPTPQDGKPDGDSNKIDATKGAKSATAPTTKPSAASSDTQNHPAGGTKTMREDEEYDEDQLDEVSLDTAAKVYKKRADNAMSGETKNKYPSQDVDQQVRSREIIGKRFGLKGKQMAKSIEKKYDNYSQ
jgi:hypothetical protein